LTDEKPRYHTVMSEFGLNPISSTENVAYRGDDSLFMTGTALSFTERVTVMVSTKRFMIFLLVCSSILVVIAEV
jgi:hypothetical protein